ncbi:MAG: hypothetical protein ACE5IW_11560 [bacterium]
MLNCHDIRFSEKLSQERVEQAYSILGQAVVNRIVCFSLFLLGVNRSFIAKCLNIPVDTVKSLLKRIFREGLPALEDRRQKSSSFLPLQEEKPDQSVLNVNDDHIVVEIGRNNQRMKIPRNNNIQSRVVLLTLLNNKLLTSEEVAAVLGLSKNHIQQLSKKLHKDDVYSILDKRQGQQLEYRFSHEVKSELIQQFVFDVVTRGTTSGERLVSELQERCDINLSARTIRYHINKLGLNRIKRSLPALLQGFKKNSEKSY